VIPLTILTFVALAFLVFLGSQVWTHYTARGGAAQAKQLTPVDLDAFENLIDPEEEQFLKVNLMPAEFRGVQRARIRAARMYVAALSENAGVLVAVGQSARSHPNPEIAATGLEIIQRSLRLKVWCLLAMFRLSAAVVFPTILSPSSRITNQYLLVTYMAANLSRKAPV
jgi:hypothetical protein